jgi:hypothetical protein
MHTTAIAQGEKVCFSPNTMGLRTGEDHSGNA